MDEVHRSRFGNTGHADRRINIVTPTFTYKNVFDTYVVLITIICTKY